MRNGRAKPVIENSQRNRGRRLHDQFINGFRKGTASAVPQSHRIRAASPAEVVPITVLQKRIRLSFRGVKRRGIRICFFGVRLVLSATEGRSASRIPACLPWRAKPELDAAFLCGPVLLCS